LVCTLAAGLVEGRVQCLALDYEVGFKQKGVEDGKAKGDEETGWGKGRGTRGTLF